ncbi:MAG: A/G-specific adenine glycosylase [Spirochaetes bacterium]|nr:A/G-specific adenine glycosylase [Spirochaetota bacterium]
MDRLLDGLAAVRKSFNKKKKIDAAIKKKFLSCIYDYYDSNYRHLPWRTTDNSYHILVSEIMLQQTQVARVIEKYNQFIKKFPSVESLAKASFHEVLAVWQGLGYNRRAKYLWECAKIVVTQYNGKIPDDEKELQKLPGLGKATAASVSIFAFGKPALYVETNVRTVYIYTFFTTNDTVADVLILPLLQSTMDKANPKRFYNALMDTGAYIKQHYNYSRHSTQYKVQSPYHSSLRKVRGDIVRFLVHNGTVHKEVLLQHLNYPLEKIHLALDALCKENMICEEKNFYTIRTK